MSAYRKQVIAYRVALGIMAITYGGGLTILFCHAVNNVQIVMQEGE